ASFGHTQHANHIVDAHRQVESDHAGAPYAVLIAQMEGEAIGGLVQFTVGHFASGSADRRRPRPLCRNLFEHAMNYQFCRHLSSNSSAWLQTWHGKALAKYFERQDDHEKIDIERRVDAEVRLTVLRLQALDSVRVEIARPLDAVITEKILDPFDSMLQENGAGRGDKAEFLTPCDGGGQITGCDLAQGIFLDKSVPKPLGGRLADPVDHCRVVKRVASLDGVRICGTVAVIGQQSVGQPQL